VGKIQRDLIDNKTAIRGLYQELMNRWNAGSGDGFAALFEVDADQVAFDGTHFRTYRTKESRV